MKQLGDLGFRCWLGRVEDINDPMKLGRIRVRLFNVHGDAASTPTDTLHWWPVSLPITSASNSEVGRSPTGLLVGSVVWGFFTDGEDSQHGLVCGVLVGENDVPLLAKGTNNIQKEVAGPEPESAYRAQYPHNHVTRSKSGHVIEIDDTPNYERLHFYHRTGTYTEIDQDGRRVNKIVGDDYEIVQRGKQVWIQGNLDITVLGNANIEVQGATKIDTASAEVNVTGDTKVTSALVEVTAPISIFNGNVRINGSLSVGAGGGAGGATIKGDVAIEGTVNATADVNAGGISLMTHVHGGVDSGPSTTSGPQ